MPRLSLPFSLRLCKMFSGILVTLLFFDAVVGKIKNAQRHLKHRPYNLDGVEINLST